MLPCPAMDQSPTSRLTVSEAAGVLGISVEAVRGRVKRGTIAHERAGGTVYVLLESDQPRPGATSQRPADDRPTDQSELVAQLRDEIAFLRDQVRRQQEIIGAQAVTMRQLTAAAQEEPPEAAETVEEEPEGSEPRSATGSTQEATQRPWWRRLFGG